MASGLIRKPSALVPLAMSVAAIALVVGHAALFGIAHEVDEGAAAHVFQLLMVAQVPVIAFFAAKWLPRCRREALRILVLQVAGVVVAFACVYLLT